MWRSWLTSEAPSGGGVTQIGVMLQHGGNLGLDDGDVLVELPDMALDGCNDTDVAEGFETGCLLGPHADELAPAQLQVCQSLPRATRSVSAASINCSGWVVQRGRAIRPAYDLRRSGTHRSPARQQDKPESIHRDPGFQQARIWKVWAPTSSG